MPENTTIEKPPKKRKLTLKQKRWLKYYLETGNKAEAARRAGYVVGRLGGKTDKEHESKTMTNIGIRNVEKLGEELENEIKREGLSWLTPEYVLNSLNALATKDSTPAQAKINALELLGKYQGLFKEKQEIEFKALQLIGELKPTWSEGEEKKPEQLPEPAGQQ